METNTTTVPADLGEIKAKLRCGANASGLILILFYVLVYGSAAVLAVVMKSFGDINEGFLSDLFNLLAYTLQYPFTVPILLGIFWLTCGKKTGQRLRDCIKKPAVPTKTMLRWVIICLGVTYAGSYISRMFWLLFQSLTGLELTAQSFAADPSWLSMLTNIIAMVIYAPIFEELMFRGTILRSMEHGGELPAALMCGIVFGLWHTNFDQTIYTAVMGFCAAMLYLKTRTVLAPFLLHVLMNSIGAFQSLFIGDLDPYKMLELEEAEMMTYMAEHAGNIAVIMLSALVVMVLMGLGIILLIIELVNHGQLFRFEKGSSGMSTGQVMKHCLTSPLMLIACIALLAMTVLRAMGIL
ncbi:MAG: CPBP family intramembrane metalloprotease [Oscillospiraceae bacterium]|nr:CPBP family intramembrane metalloprotease [Oscillospiraceae bacterium]